MNDLMCRVCMVSVWKCVCVCAIICRSLTFFMLLVVHQVSCIIRFWASDEEKKAHTRHKRRNYGLISENVKIICVWKHRFLIVYTNHKDSLSLSLSVMHSLPYFVRCKACNQNTKAQQSTSIRYIKCFTFCGVNNFFFVCVFRLLRG